MPTSAREGYIGFGKQTQKGTGVAPTKFIKWTGATDMSPKHGIARYREGGDSYDPGIALKENHKPGGSVSLFARPDLVGFLFAALLGADAVSGVGPYTHAITPGTPPWLSVERSLGGIQERFIDCKIKSISAEGEAGKPIKLTVEYLGINEDLSVSAATATYEVDAPFVYWQATFTWDGGASTNVEKFKLTYTNAFDEEFFTNAITRQDIPLQSRDAELEMTVSMEDSMVFFKKAYHAAGTAPGTDAPTGSFIVDLNYGAGADARQLKLDLQKVFYTEAPVEQNSDDGRLRYEIKAAGGKATGSPLLTVTAKNGTSGAYV